MFSLANYKTIEIIGNGATLLFHGRIMPFLFENCQSVKIKGLTINWDIPFTFLGEVVSINSKRGGGKLNLFRTDFAGKSRRVR